LKEDICDREGRSLVAVHEGVILRQALPKGGGFLNQVSVVASLGPKKRGLQQAVIADANRAAVALNLIRVDRDRLHDGDVIRHSASFL
jgi:hypothetical protein